MTQPGFDSGTFLYHGGCSIHWATGLGRCSGWNFLVSWTSFRVCIGMRDHKRVIASRMNEIHTLLTLDKPGGEYYKGGQSLLPTKSASSSSAFSHMILALRGERAELCPVNPIPLEVCYNMSQCPLCKLPDTRIFHIGSVLVPSSGFT